MKNYSTSLSPLALLVAANLLPSQASFADDFTVSATLDAVTVYQSGGALLKRHGSVNLPKGHHRLIITGLPEDLDDDYGVRALLAAPGIIVGAVHTEERFPTQAPSPDQQKLQARIDALRHDIDSVQTQLNATDMQLDFLRSIGRNKSAEDAAADAKTWQAALDFLGQSGGTLFAKRKTEMDKITNISKEISALEKELASLGNNAGSSYDAVIELDVAASNPNAAFEISYMSDNASWHVGTDAALSSAASKANIRLMANVMQDTGEDWRGVRLSLSTARPSTEIGASELEPVFLNIRDKNDYKIRRMEADMRMSAPMAAEEIIVTGSRMIQNSTMFDSDFTVPTPADVPSGDEAPQRFLINEASLPASLVTRASPQLDGGNAFVYADVTLKGLPRLDHVAANLTRDGHFVGQGQWPDFVPDQKVRLPFGLDSSIKIETIPLPPQDGDTGLFAKKNVTEQRLVYRITNNRQSNAVVEITDRLPVSAHEDVKIELLKGATRASESNMNGKQGLMLWRKDMKPGEVWEIHHEYRVTYPADSLLEPVEQ